MQGPGDPRFGYQKPPYAPPQQPPAQQVAAPGVPRVNPYATYTPQPYGAPPPPQAHPHAQAHFGGLPMPGSLSALSQPSGLPAPIAFGLALGAVVVALVFDVVFLKVHIPGVGSYAWYLTTALSFAGAGWGAATWTRASKMTAMTAMTIAAVLYGAADLGLGLVVEELSLAGAVMLGAQGVAIACVTGFGAVYKGFAAKED